MSAAEQLRQAAEQLGEAAAELSTLAEQVAAEAPKVAAGAAVAHGGIDPFVFQLSIFALACFVGYYVVWRVTPALHSPLMAVTNAISSVIIVGALIAAGPVAMGTSKIMGFFAVVLASVNIFGGFIVTHRMLQMFSKKKK